VRIESLLELELWPVGGTRSRCGYEVGNRGQSADWRGEFFGEV
jgi:hypothetical protein